MRVSTYFVVLRSFPISYISRGCILKSKHATVYCRTVFHSGERRLVLLYLSARSLILVSLREGKVM
jgi:hypothetical protein